MENGMAVIGSVHALEQIDADELRTAAAWCRRPVLSLS
jgi:hypothetical protein